MECWSDGFEGILSIKNGLFNFITQHSIIPDGQDFDLSLDNGEKKNLAKKHPELCKKFKENVFILEKYIQ